MVTMPTDAKKPELPLGAPVHVQKRRPLYTYFANEKGLLPNPVYHPEIEQKKQEDFMEPRPFVKEEKDKVRKNLLPALEEADSKAVVRMEEEPVYEDMATEGPSEDSDVENHLIYPESWKDSDVVTVAETMIDGAPASGDSETNDTDRVCSERLSTVEPKEHDEEGAMGPDSASAGDDNNDDLESDEGTIEVARINYLKKAQLHSNV
ncbi:protein S100-A13 [Platysternon megacephalum]|uniref:Protein S100-A13 n=1 Tax=Platysternon megacephalum TaxID=55544 RepID=A0A4D9DNX1_9SAUR|nr:protein S100-A13 [Platysternon megacephalum]